jgi:phage shock protein C
MTAPDSESAAHRTLRRSRDNRVIAGVCGGLGEYLGVDPVLLRIAFVVLAFTGSGVLLYIIGWIIMPEAKGGEIPVTHSTTAPPSADAIRLIVGGLFIALGAIVLLDNVFDWFSDLVWPSILITIGAAVIVYGARK